MRNLEITLAANSQSSFKNTKLKSNLVWAKTRIVQQHFHTNAKCPVPNVAWFASTSISTLCVGAGCFDMATVCSKLTLVNAS